MRRISQEGQEQRLSVGWKQGVNHYEFEEEQFQLSEIYGRQIGKDKWKEMSEGDCLFWYG